MENNTQYSDLHIHTVFSDGRKTPEEIFNKCIENSFKAFSITDHDTLCGVYKALEIKDKYDIEFIPGIEISCHEGKREFHLLAYDFDPYHDRLLNHIEILKGNRRKRAEKIIKRLDKINIKIDLDYVLQLAGDAPITRPHIAQAMLDMGKVTLFKEAFMYYLAKGKPGYVDKTGYPIKLAIEVVHQAGGVTSVAHPGYALNPDIMKKFQKYGLDGVEVIHPSHNEYIRNKLFDLATKFNMLTTGGSDYHGIHEYEEGNFGKSIVPHLWVENIHKLSEAKKSAMNLAINSIFG